MVHAALADQPPQRNHPDLIANQRKLRAQLLGMPAENREYTLIDAMIPAFAQ